MNTSGSSKRERSAPTRSWRRRRTWSSLAQMRKKYGSIDDAVARIEAGQSPVDPSFRETRAQRKAREDAEKERKKNLPDPFREFVEEGDARPYMDTAPSTSFAREEKYRQQGKRPGDVHGHARLRRVVPHLTFRRQTSRRPRAGCALPHRFIREDDIARCARGPSVLFLEMPRWR